MKKIATLFLCLLFLVGIFGVVACSPTPGEKGEKGAKYTKSHTAVSIQRVWRAPDRPCAARLEYRIKQLKKAQKEGLVSGDLTLSDVLADKLDTAVYQLIR